ncbi:MAG: DUF6516 family protein [Gemmatimonadetes bacterium]|nr:DUF6516 family protein [Gemmatimonadota bacterium]MDE2735037.1 DUF6516 family protein [Gemmatimonadota bacterium]
MAENPLESLADYSYFLAKTMSRPSVLRSTIRVWSSSPFTGTAEGEATFANGVRLRMREELDFADGLITSYGYEVYRGTERLYWYDDFPHPEESALASTFPHHKHVPPDIKRNRIPAPNLQFTGPNLIAIIEEIESLH